MLVNKLRHFVLGTGAMICTALFLVSAIVWVWSFRTVAVSRFSAFDRDFRATSGRGSIELFWQRSIVDPPEQAWSTHPAVVSETPAFQYPRRTAGFAYREDDAGASLLIPDWIFPIVFVLVPLWWCVRALGILTPRGRCLNCGASFRDKHNRCPKCGTVWM